MSSIVTLQSLGSYQHDHLAAKENLHEKRFLSFGLLEISFRIGHIYSTSFQSFGNVCFLYLPLSKKMPMLLEHKLDMLAIEYVRDPHY